MCNKVYSDCSVCLNLFASLLTSQPSPVSDNITYVWTGRLQKRHSGNADKNGFPSVNYVVKKKLKKMLAL